MDGIVMLPIRAAMTNPSPVAFTAFGYSVYWYGILMAAGICLAFFLANHEVKRKKLHPDTALDICLITVPLGLVGARLYYVLFNLKYYLADPIRILYVWEGGLAIYGAVIGGLIGLAIYAKKKRVSLMTLLDVCAPGVVLAQAVGRWGNYFNQEAYGPLVTNPSHMWFPLSVMIDKTQEIHYATFFYESVWCLLIFAFLWFFLRKRQKHNGDVFLWYVLLYAFGRIFVEGMRMDSLYLWGNIRVSQLLSAVAFLGVLTFFILRAARKKNNPPEALTPEEAEASTGERPQEGDGDPSEKENPAKEGEAEEQEKESASAEAAEDPVAGEAGERPAQDEGEAATDETKPSQGETGSAEGADTAADPENGTLG